MPNISAIARIRSDFPAKFGIPRQSGLVPHLQSTIIFEPKFRNDDALRGLEDFSHMWLIWGFSENEQTEWNPTVRPPRLGGNARMGVFATRSPFRPNALGLSSVKILKIEKTAEYGSVIHVLGADLMDGTPIYDIKPYISSTDCHTDATSGFTNQNSQYALVVNFPPELLQKIPIEKQQPLVEVLAQDPRPQYHNDENRVYGFVFANFEIKFCVKNGCVEVCGVEDFSA